MAEYIERELALRIIIQKQKELCPLGTYGKKYVDGYDREKFDDWQEIIDEIESVPAADVEEVKHGKWEWFEEEHGTPIDGYDYDWGWHCSNCKAELSDDYDDPDTPPKMRYCPHCGAKMGAEG